MSRMLPGGAIAPYEPPGAWSGRWRSSPCVSRCRWRGPPPPGVDADPDLYLDAVRSADLRGVALYRFLHGQGGVARPYCMIFVGQWRSKQGHDAIAQHLIHSALVAVHGRHQAFEDRVERLAGFFGIPVGEQLHGALQVGEEHRDLLALAFESALRVEDLLSQMHGRVRAWARSGSLAGTAAVAVPLIQTSTLPSSSTARRWASMSSAFGSSGTRHRARSVV